MSPRPQARRCPLAACAIAALGAAAACSRSPPFRYYTLVAAPPSTPEASGVGGPSVAVGPVMVPETVDRPEIVLRLSDTQLALADQDRWAEPLASEFARALVAKLGQVLTAARIGPAGSVGAEPDFELRVDVLHFESRLGQSARLEALWSLRRPGGADLRQGRSLVSVPAAGAGIDALVRAHARALALMSAEIAQAIRSESRFSAARPRPQR